MNPNGDHNPRPACPSCASQYVKRYGHNGAGHQRYVCKPCGFQFVALPPAVELKAKSGAIAGTITIGRGSRWGASLL